MKPVVALDSTPLGLIVQKRDHAKAEKCRQWLRGLMNSGVRVIVPEIVNYELRRELLRLGKANSVTALASFNAAVHGRLIPITTVAMELAAELWATARKQGKPTADPHSLDIDVIIAAQLLTSEIDPKDFVVATSNVSHISLFAPAELWENIEPSLAFPS